MAFPQTAAPTVSSFNTDATSHAVQMPATVNAGDLLLLLFSSDGSTSTIQAPTGIWNPLHQTVGSLSRLTAWYGIATGTEGGTTVNVETSVGEKAVAHVYRITAWHGTTPPEIGTAATGTSANPDPPTLSPSWGAADTLWLAVEGNDNSTTTSVYPTSYLNGVNSNSGGGANLASISSARRELNASSDDPSTFTISASQAWIAQTYAIRPAAGVAPVTGTIAATQAGDTMAATGAESMSGTVAATQGSQTSAITGTVANPITGTMAANQNDQAGAIVGSLNISGTIAATQAGQTAAISGTVANPITGTIGVTQVGDTGAFAGDIVADGTLNAIQANQTAAINGTVVNPITGVLDSTQGDDTGAFTGTSVVNITGTLAAMEGDDTAAITGDSISPAVTGTIAATQDDDTMVANGIAAFGVAGTISVTQDDDVMTASGDAQVAVTGDLDATQANQTMTATGSVVNLVAGAVVTVTCTIGGPTLACVIGGPILTCTISPVSVIAGSNFVVTATFRDAMGDLANPTSVSAVIQAPDGTQTTPTPTSTTVGVWTTVVPTDQAGFWFYQISGAGADIDVVCHGSVCVEPALVLV